MVYISGAGIWKCGSGSDQLLFSNRGKTGSGIRDICGQSGMGGLLFSSENISRDDSGLRINGILKLQE